MTLVKPKLKPLIAACFSGAGTLASLHVGATSAIEEKYDFSYLVGTSAGAIVAGCIATGMSVAEMKYEVENADYSKLIPYNRVLAVFRGYLASNTNARNWLLKLTKYQTMSDCIIPLLTISSNLYNGKVATFTKESHPTMYVADAILASMSIPDIFPAYKHQFVDGGVLCNLGVRYLPRTGGRIALRVTETGVSGPVNGFISEQERLISMMLSASEEADVLLGKAYNVPVINLPAGNAGFLERYMPIAERRLLYSTGFIKTQEALNSLFY